ncbi:hypothetical protein AXG93_1998s1010 [Marchantia polymorpha subsp. ruderalis]|uniref:DUF1664 domain-containing protein n=1 Tax=Marchantia polymorpha subsp. ruderalis TaxID=1480154 RepID=A0A176VLQ6_MARPO|nr:hypothetical protein AXG93_1998s1010 [Marchantia polymorpha subsp. ruderalis]
MEGGEEGRKGGREGREERKSRLRLVQEKLRGANACVGSGGGSEAASAFFSCGVSRCCRWWCRARVNAEGESRDGGEQGLDPRWCWVDDRTRNWRSENLRVSGVGGSIVLRNSKISDILADLSRVLSKHLQEDGDRPSGSGGDSTEALTAQVRRLTMELRQLAASNRPITVVNGSPSSGGNLGSLIVPAAVLGVAGYGYMWLKVSPIGNVFNLKKIALGWSFSDVMYVTRRNMSNAVASMSKQLETFSAALVATKRQLTLRLDNVSKSLEHNTALTHAIQAQVGQVRGDVAQVGLEMREVQRQIEGLEGKIDEVQGKQDFTNQGIVLLCRFVLQGLEGGGQPELLQGFHAYSRTRLERSTSSSFAASSGLKELQHFSEKLLIQTGSPGDANPTSNRSSPNLQRSLTTTVLGGIIPSFRDMFAESKAEFTQYRVSMASQVDGVEGLRRLFKKV